MLTKRFSGFHFDAVVAHQNVIQIGFVLNAKRLCVVIVYAIITAFFNAGYVPVFGI